MKTLAVANHKGGVGKTATVRALGDVLSSAGLRVLMVDTDPQSSLTTSCGLTDVSPSLADVFDGMDLARVIRQVSDNLDLIPSNLALAKTELALIVRISGREVVLRKTLATVAEDYDICLIDCPPSLNMLVINALVASDSVLIPAQPMPVDLAAVRLFLETMDILRQDYQNLTLLGILPTFFDQRLNAHQGAISAMLEAGWPVLPVRIGRSVRVGESAALGESIMTFEPDNPQAANYQELGEAVMLWLGAKKK